MGVVKRKQYNNYKNVVPTPGKLKAKAKNQKDSGYKYFLANNFYNEQSEGIVRNKKKQAQKRNTKTTKSSQVLMDAQIQDG